jgi:hypothetical protein
MGKGPWWSKSLLEISLTKGTIEAAWDSTPKCLESPFEEMLLHFFKAP